jgi:hypothetical protein
MTAVYQGHGPTRVVRTVIKRDSPKKPECLVDH